MRHPDRPATVLLLALAAACAGPSESWAAPPPALQQGTTPPADDFEPIRFGDPAELEYTAPFFEEAEVDPSVPRPEDVLGQPLGTRLSHHAEILECFRRWEGSPRLDLAPYARTFEGRELVRAVITSPANLARIDAIRADLAKLADPRGLSDAEAERIVTSSPAVAWLGYSIHGDELSGSDAAVALAYHLIAGTGPEVTGMLDDLVVVIDPVMNPDGRERIIGMIEQGMGYVPNLDYEGMSRGRWPHGRGNHYLFDMNRDWLAGTAPETRGRWAEVRKWHPQLFVDAHEMGALENYLFYPQADPLNPNLPDNREWNRRFAADQSAAFDRHGWSYYTREWAEGWYPAYSDSWGALNGAIGILYEQASTDGQAVRRESGAVRTYRESVHHHATSSLANLRTLRANREELLRHFLDLRRSNVAPERTRAFVLRPSGRPTREAELIRTLVRQGVEVYRAGADFEAKDVVDALGRHSDSLELPAGSWIVPHRQPQSPIVRAFLDPDPRYDRAALEKERRDLQKDAESNIYDVTSWSLVHLFDLDGLWCDAAGLAGVERTRVADGPPPEVGVVEPEGTPAAAWIVDGRDDAAPVFAARAMELGLAVHLGDEPFRQAGRGFSRWSLVVRREENPRADVAELVARAAERAGALAVATRTSRSPDEGPDLGGGHFTLLRRPRVGMLSNSPIERDAYGHLWYHLDHELRLGFTALDAQTFGWYDLRRFNVLIVPPGEGDLGGLLEQHAEALTAWVRGGGTLIACGDAAAALASGENELTSVVLRRDALEELDDFAWIARREREATEVTIDEGLLWDGVATSADEGAAEDEHADDDHNDDEEAAEGEADPDAERADEWARRFAPQGVTLRGVADVEHWLAAGCDEVFPAYVSGSYAYLSRPPVETPIRLAPAPELRIAGLLWPEARERLAESAYVTVESIGNGQVILFAGVPGFRGSYDAGARLLSNAVIYGVGAGTSQPVPR